MKTKKTIGVLILIMILTSSIFAQPWNVNPADYQFSMTVTGETYVNDTIINQQNAYIGAFVNGECRGVCKTSEQEGEYKTFYLTTYSNQTEGDTIFFKFMNENSVEHDISNYILFKNDASYGLSVPFLWMDDPMYGARDFLSFALDSQVTEAIIDYEDRSISIMVTRNTDISNLTPIFTLAPEANAYVNQVEQISAQTANDFSNIMQYIVKGINGREAYWSVEVTFDNSGIEELDKNKFSFYPNPANDYLIITSKNFKSENVEIFDVTGKIVKKFIINSEQSTVDISSLNRGFYSVTTESFTQKLIIN